MPRLCRKDLPPKIASIQGLPMQSRRKTKGFWFLLSGITDRNAFLWKTSRRNTFDAFVDCQVGISVKLSRREEQRFVFNTALRKDCQNVFGNFHLLSGFLFDVKRKSFGPLPDTIPQLSNVKITPSEMSLEVVKT